MCLWARLFGRRKRMMEDLDQDIRDFIERETRDNIERGMAPEEARYAALRKFGNITRIREETWELWSFVWLEQLWQDVRYGLRQLRRSPGFTAVAVLTLALGIGGNTAIFTVVNAVLLHPLPYPDSGRIVDIVRQSCRGCGATDSVPEFVFWRQYNPGFEDLAAYMNGASSVNLRGGDRPELVQALKASRSYFRLFRANPILGRIFSEDEDQRGGRAALLMSYGLWQRRFAGDPAIVGRTLNLGGAPYNVVGVLSPSFKPYPSTEVWIPLQADPNSRDQAHILMVSARLPGGTTLAKANSWMAVMGKRFAQAHPEQAGGDHPRVTLMQQQMTGDVRPMLLILLGAVGLVLVIACANVANLLLARALRRQREIAIRSSMGAGRGRIVRQLLTECMLLALAGGALGLVAGTGGVRALLALAPANLPRVEEIAAGPTLDPWVAGFAVLLSTLTGIVFGLAPALQHSRTDLTSFLKESARGAGTGLKHRRTSSILVAAEFGMTVVLLCGAVLLIRSFAALRSVRPGFEPRSLLTLKVPLADPELSVARSVNGLQRQIVERVERIPGVELASVSSSLPTQPIVDMVFNIPGRPPRGRDKFNGDVLWCAVSTDYFNTLRIPLHSGRLFREQEPPHTVIINEALARKFWPDQNSAGKTILIGAGLGPALDQGPTEIVGVVGDARDRLNADPPPTMYQAWSNIPDAGISLMSQLYPASIAVRTKAGVAPMSVSKGVEQALLTGDAPLPVTKVETMEQVMLESIAQANFSLLLLGIFAAVALALATVGIYGVISYSVAHRTHEIGIRIALGAQQANVLRLVVGQGLTLILIGVGLGLAGAFGLTRFLANMLYGVRPTDPMTFAVVALLLTGVALLACYIPARRAMKVDPMVALRYE